VESAVPVAEFAAQSCRRCGEPMAAHGIRPLHVAELSAYVTAAELICPTPKAASPPPPSTHKLRGRSLS
jgi:hypothetical protein